MFENIGSKIKALASVACAVGIAVSIIGGIIVMCTVEELIGIGFVVMIGGSLLSWLSSFVLYGFGELVENSAIVARKTEQSIVGSNDGEFMSKNKNEKVSYLNDLKARGLITIDEYNKKLAELENEK